MHGDLSKNNIMLDRRNAHAMAVGLGSRITLNGASSRFQFIDWASADVNGYPYYDLVRIGNTFRSTMNQRLKTHYSILQSSEEDVGGTITAALGSLRDNLGYCPRHVFALSAQKYLSDLTSYELVRP